MEITISGKPERVVTKKTDSRGRIALGSDYGNQEVTVLIIDPDD